MNTLFANARLSTCLTMMFAMCGAAGCGTAASTDAGDGNTAAGDVASAADTADTGMTTAGTFGCDSMSSTQHGCVEYSGYPATAPGQFCPASHGTIVAMCSHTGSMGGCLVHLVNGTGRETTTQWYYDTPTATIMSMCASLGGTFVNP